MSKQTLAGSAAIMASGTLVSRFLGLVRAALLAASIATVGGAADAFSVANKLPTIIYMLIAGGVLNAVLVPQIVRAMRNPDGGHRYVNQLLTLGTLTLGILTTILTAGAGVLITLYAAAMTPEWKPLALTFAYICLPQLFFYGLYTLLGQVLNARGNFGPYMWAPALNNVVSILGLGVYLFLYGEYQWASATPADWDATRIWLVAGTATAGIVAQALVLLIPLYRSGFRITPVFQVRGSGLGRASTVAAWAFAALLVGQLGYLVISNLAVAANTAGSELGITVAANAAYDYAFTIFMLPQSLITVSLVTALFTRLSHHAVAGEAHIVRDQLSMGLRTLAVFTVFASAALMVLAVPIVAVILAGRPGWPEQQAIGHVVVAFSAGLVPIGAWTLMQRVYYAYEDTRTLFRIQIPMMLIVVAASALSYVLLPPTWWVAIGAALGTTLSNSFGALVSYLALRRKLPSIDGANVLRTHLRLVLAVIPTALAGWALLHVWGVRAGLIGSLVRVLVIGALMGVGYLVLLRLLRVPELDTLLLRVVTLARPLTRRLAPMVNRLPGAGVLHKIGSFFAPSEGKPGAVSKKWDTGDTIAQRYRLDACTATQTHGDHSLVTWEAHDTILGKDVRVVTLHGEHERVEAALDSARRRAVLTDACFPQIFRVLEDGDDGVVVTEVVSGPTMTELISQGGLTADEVRSIVGEAARAVERAHRQGVQHLSLTPDALVVSGGSVKILGLGYESALSGVQVKSSDQGVRKDTTALAQILYAGLSGAWTGSRRIGLPSASQTFSSAQELHEAAPDAPMDLIRLCHLAMSPFDEGPHTPSELAESLRPWRPIPEFEPAMIVAEDFVTGEFTAVAVQAAAPGTVTASLEEAEVREGAADPPEPEPAPPADPQPAPAADPEVTNGAAPVPPAATIVASPQGWDLPEGTAPVEIRAAEPPARAEAPGGDSTLLPVRPRTFTRVEPEPVAPLADEQTPPPLPRPSDRLRGLTSSLAEQFRPVGDGKERRFRPAGFVLLTMLALVVFALVLATSSLRSAWNFDPSTIPAPTPVETEDQPVGEEMGSADPSPENEDDTSSPESPSPIVIKEAITFDPSTSGGENQDLAGLAIDGDRSTYWRSMRYNSPTYAIKPGLGFSVVLEEEAEVSQVQLMLNGRGGKVEIRTGDPRDPTAGEVLASGSMDGTTTFTFSQPVATDTIVLWFPELPIADSDGMNRIELAEVSLE